MVLGENLEELIVENVMVAFRKTVENASFVRTRRNLVERIRSNRNARKENARGIKNYHPLDQKRSLKIQVALS